jgi:hypothetical protein
MIGAVKQGWKAVFVAECADGAALGFETFGVLSTRSLGAAE